MSHILGRALGALGLLAAAFYIALEGFSTVPWSHWIGAVSALSLAAWVYLDWDLLCAIAGSRGGREQTVSWVLITVVAASGVLALHIAQRSPVRWDLSEGEVHSLDPQFITILEQLDPNLDTRILGFFTEPSSASDDAQLQRFFQLGEAVRGVNPRLSFERVNPDYDPIQTARHGISRSGTVLVTVRAKEPPNSLTPPEGEARSEQIEGPDEQALANALLRLQQERVRTVTFVTGHGEASPTEPGETSVTAFATVLGSIGYRVDTWSSPEAKEVPLSTDILVLAGPRVALQTGEVTLIGNWVDQGGALFALIDPELDQGVDPGKGLDTLLATWGLSLGHDLVLDPVQSDQGVAVLPLGLPAGAHSIVRAMPANIPLAFKMAQSVDTAESPEGGPSSHKLVVSSSEGWGETDLTAEEISADPAVDHLGPVAFAAASQFSAEGSEEEARVVLVGDLDWLSDGRIAAAANGDFATRVIAYLGSQDDLIQLPPRDRSVTRLELTGMRLPLLILLAVLLVPGATGLTGVVLWGMRRNR